MKTYHWFQNLAKEDRSEKLFHFRGEWGPDYKNIWLEYEFSSGPAFRIGFKIKPYNSLSLTLGLFFFTAYLTFPFLSFAKFITQAKVTELYWFNWALVWKWMGNEWESNSGEPWWKSFYFHVDDFFLGKAESVKDELISEENIKFKIGEKEFLMNSIKWVQYRRFRQYIPFALYHDKWVSVDMKIDNPPMRAGKGENSWDCDDDGSFGIHMPWKHERPTWQNRKESVRLAVKDYILSAQKDAKRYGSGSGERGIKASDTFEVLV